MVNVSFEKAIETALLIKTARIQNRELYVQQNERTCSSKTNLYSMNQKLKTKSDTVSLQKLGFVVICLHCDKKSDNFRVPFSKQTAMQKLQ